MTSDHDALLAAVLAAPDDDLPRLVYADWVEEQGEPDRAAFIRAQIELARTPPWEPFSVRCQAFHSSDLVRGQPRAGDLPDLGDGRLLGWDPDFAFRRGFGWGLAVRQPRTLAEVGARIFATAPVGRLSLWDATLDDWRAVAARPWLARVTDIHFVGLPGEPLWVLGESPHAGGLTALSFERAGSPGMPDITARLMRSPVGPRLTDLRFRNGCDAVEEMIDSLAAGDVPPKLGRLEYAGGNLTPATLARLLALPVVPPLTALGLFNNPFGPAGARVLAAAAPPGLADLDLRYCFLDADAAAELAGSPQLTTVRRLDLGRNPLGPDGIARIAASGTLAGLRSLGLSQTGTDDRAVAELTRADFWPSLVELDLRHNPISDAGAAPLLITPVPPDLQVLWLDGHRLSERVRTDLRRQFGDRVLLG